MSEPRTGWFAAAGQIVGDLENCEMVYSWDGTVHESRGYAISAGFTEFGHDDFNIGRLEQDRLVWWGWMDEEHSDADHPAVARALGLRRG
jgi:hypothetical protein